MNLQSIFFLIIILFSGTSVTAQPPEFQFPSGCNEPTLFEGHAFSGVVYLDGVPVSVGNDIIAFFNSNGGLIGRMVATQFNNNGNLGTIGFNGLLRYTGSCPSYTGNNPVTVKLWKSSTNTVHLAPNSVFNCVGSFNTINGPDNNFAVADTFNFSTTLPVELVDFEASVQGNTVELTWRTSEEVNNSHFEIEHSSNPVNGFQRIGKVLGSNTTDDLNRYKFIDISPTDGVNYYRLRQVDFDGVFAYSPITVASIQQVEIPAIGIFPNPVHPSDHLTIHLSGNWADEPIQLALYSNTGKLIRQWTKSFRDSYSVKIKDLPAGLYHMQAVSVRNTCVAPIVIR